MEKRTYQLQTKLYHVEDVLVSWGPIRLTLRQCFVLVLGGCGSLDLWPVLDGLTSLESLGLVLRIMLTSLPTLLALGISIARIADRYAETWMGVLLWYATHARAYVWLPQGTNASSKRRRKPRSSDKRTMTHQDQRKEDELA